MANKNKRTVAAKKPSRRKPRLTPNDPYQQGPFVNIRMSLAQARLLGRAAALWSPLLTTAETTELLSLADMLGDKDLAQGDDALNSFVL